MTNEFPTHGLPLDGDEQLFDRRADVHEAGATEARELFAKAQRALGLDVPFAAFAKRLDPASSDAHCNDLFLATACSERVEGATELLLARHGHAITAALRRMQLSTSQRDDAYSKTLEVVFVGEGGQPAIDGYRGRGSLEGWLKVSAVRAAHRVLRSPATRTIDTDPQWALDSATAEAVWSTQERHLLDAEGTEAFRGALRDALEALRSEERRTLRLHYVERLSIDALAQMWGTHRATAARRVAKLRQRIRDHVLEHLQAEFGSSPSSVGRWVRRMQSKLGGLTSLLR